MGYYLGRFPNGPVAFEYLWERLTGQAPGSPGSLQPSALFASSPPNAAVDSAFGASGVGALDPIPGGFLAPGLLWQIQLFDDMPIVPPSRARAYAIITGANEDRQRSSDRSMLSRDRGGDSRVFDLGARTFWFTLPDLSLIPVNLSNDKLFSKRTRSTSACSSRP